MSFLLLPREKVFQRKADNCFDILTSTDRSKLLEKFLSKRYNLIAETGVSAASNFSNFEDQQCRLELITTRTKIVEVQDLKLGGSSQVAAGTREEKSTSTSELLLGFGKPGLLDLEGKSLQVECVKGATGVYQLTFSYNEQYRNKVASTVNVKKGETIQVAKIKNDLDSQSKTLGLPQIQYEDVKGSENINFEMRIK